jgi:PAS domain S-box-containing protein
MVQWPGDDAMKSSDLIRTIFDNVSFPVLLIDRDYKIVEANHAARSHLNQREVDVIGRCCFKTTHAADEPCWHSGKETCPVKDAFETRKRVHAIHKHQLKNRLFVEEIVATPLDEVTGEVNYVIEEFRDITELLELREGILPICASCKKIRSGAGTWYRLEEYIHDHTGADFSHSICPECFDKQFPE